MKLPLLATVTCLGLSALAHPPQTKAGIPLDQTWKCQLYDFAQKNAIHTAWGLPHSERNYLLAVEISEREKKSVDRDVLFAAAFLHDIGAIAPFRKPDVDHELRSVEVAEPLLKSYGFPDGKFEAVKAVILEHMYYHESGPSSFESVVFHDADALDFLGSIGVIRIVGLTESHHGWAPNLPGALDTLKEWTKELPEKLVTSSARIIAGERIAEMKRFFEELSAETRDGQAI